MLDSFLEQAINALIQAPFAIGAHAACESVMKRIGHSKRSKKASTPSSKRSS